MQLRQHCGTVLKKAGHLPLMLLALFFSTAAFAQNGKTVKLKGFVTNDRGEPLSGVSIQVNGGANAVVSKTDGSFEIEAPENSSVSISYVGYVNQELKVGTRDQLSLKVQLTNKKDLDEVVVVGYGTRRKSEVTGSVVSVSEQSIRDIPTNNLAQALQGRAAGVDIQKINGNSKPGAGVSILIRGSRSVRAGNDPLIVVDGIPFGGNFNDINPEDVTNVEILKDASATAIYGSRGANGVVLVSTRRGRSGKAVISYNGYGGFTKPIGEHKMMNAQEFFEFKKWANVWGRYDGNTPQYAGIDDPDIITDRFSREELEMVESGGSTNWQKLVYQTGMITSHQLQVSGGSDATQYAISGNYFKEEGIYPGQEFERYTVKLSIDHQLNKMFKVSLNSLNSYATTLGEGFNPMAQAMRASPMVSPWDLTTGRLRNDFVPGSASQVWNPLADFLPGALVERRRRLGTFTTLALEANLGQWVKGLKYRFNGGAEIRSDVYGNYYGSKTSKNMGAPATASNRNNQRTAFTLENLLMWDKTINGVHKINVTGLYSVQQQETQSNSFGNDNVFSPNLEFYNPEYGASLVGSGDYDKWALISYMGRLNYSYDDRYLATFTVRSDGSSRLAPGNKWAAFPSAALAWNIHNEKFFNVPAVSNLRLRATYGIVGNASISPYQTLPQLSPYATNFGDQVTTGVYLTSISNPDLTWESTATAEVGIDFGFLNNRITGTINAYHQFTRDLLLPQTLPPTSGIQNVALSNIGKTENKGLELQLSAAIVVPKSRDDWSWSVDMNVFINRGKITELAGGVLEDVGNNWFVGKPIGVHYNLVKLGIWQNTKADSGLATYYGQSLNGTGSVIGTIRYADANGDGKLNTSSDRIILGSTQPDWSGGFTNRVGFKGFDLTVTGVARMGSMLSSALHGGGFANTYQGVYNNLKTRYWTPFNNEKEYPKPNADRTNTQNNALLGFFNGSYLKIRTITLGYALAPSMLKRLGAKSVRIYTQVEDPFIFFSPFKNHEFGGLDPEASGSASSPSTGAGVNVDTPPTWSLILGLNISF